MKYKTQYLKDRGTNFCPWCYAKENFMPELTGLTEPDLPDAFVEYVDAEEIEIYQEWKCNICESTWRDIHRLSDVVPIPKEGLTNG